MALPADGRPALVPTPDVIGGAPQESREAFAEHHDYLCQTLRRFGARPEDIEDLAQDVFVVMCRRWHDYDPHRPLRAWLGGIAFNVAQKHGTRQWREAPAGEVELVDESPQPDERLHSARARRLVLTALAAMAPRDRAVLVLHQIDELPMQAVAAALKVPLFTAYTRLRRARLRFAEVVAQLQARAPGRRDPLSPKALLELERQQLPPVPRPPRRGWIAIAGCGLVASLGAVLGLRGPAPRSAPPPGPAWSAPARGLVGHWSFEDGRGSTLARDRSGAGRDCVLRDLDDRAWLPGAIGGAVRLENGGWLECPQPPSALRADTEVSVLAWVKPRGRGLMALVARQLDQDKRDQFFLGMRNWRLKVRSSLWTKDVNGTEPLAPNRWTHVAFTQSADGTTRLYQDGVLVGEARNNAWTGEATLVTPLTIGVGINGRSGQDPGQAYRGLIDEVAIYDRALQPQEVAAVAASVPRRD